MIYFAKNHAFEVTLFSLVFFGMDDGYIDYMAQKTYSFCGRKLSF